MRKRINVLRYLNWLLMAISLIMVFQSGNKHGMIGVYAIAMVLGPFQVIGALVCLPLLKDLHKIVKGLLVMYLSLVFFYFILFIGMESAGVNENNQSFLEYTAGFLAVLITIVFESLHVEKKKAF